MKFFFVISFLALSTGYPYNDHKRLWDPNLFYPDTCCQLEWVEINKGNPLPDNYVHAGKFMDRDWAFVLDKINGLSDFNMVAAKSDQVTEQPNWFIDSKQTSSYTILTNPNKCSLGWYRTKFNGEEIPHNQDWFFPASSPGGLTSLGQYQGIPAQIRKFGTVKTLSSLTDSKIFKPENYDILYVDCNKSILSMSKAKLYNITYSQNDFEIDLKSVRTNVVNTKKVMVNNSPVPPKSSIKFQIEKFDNASLKLEQSFSSFFKTDIQMYDKGWSVGGEMNGFKLGGGTKRQTWTNTTNSTDYRGFGDVMRELFKIHCYSKQVTRSDPNNAIISLFSGVKYCGTSVTYEIKPGQCIDLRFTNPPRNNWARSVDSHGTCVNAWTGTSCDGKVLKVFGDSFLEFRMMNGKFYEQLQSVGSCKKATMDLEITELEILNENAIVNELLNSGQVSNIRTIVNANNANTEQVSRIKETVRITYAREIATTNMFKEFTIDTGKKWKLGFKVPVLGKVGISREDGKTTTTQIISSESNKLTYEEQVSNEIDVTIKISKYTCVESVITTKSLSGKSVDVLMTVKITGNDNTQNGTEIKKLLGDTVNVIETGAKHVIASYKTTLKGKFGSGLFVTSKDIPCSSLTQTSYANPSAADIPTPIWQVALYGNTDLTNYRTTFGGLTNTCADLQSVKGQFQSLDTQGLCIQLWTQPGCTGTALTLDGVLNCKQDTSGNCIKLLNMSSVSDCNWL